MKLIPRSETVKPSGRVTPKRRRRSDAGDTLIEVLVALLILAGASVALIIAFSTTLSASATHRDLTTSNVVLDSATQEAGSQIQAMANAFTCPLPGNPLTQYQSLDLVPPQYSGQGQYAGDPVYSAQVTSVMYWDPAAIPPAFVSASQFTPCVPNQPQQVTITVTAPNGITYSNTFVVDSLLGESGTIIGTGTPTHLAWTSPSSTPGPAGGQSGTALANFGVALENASGVPVTADFSPVILSATQDGSAVPLTGCLGTVNAGVVTFSGCTIISQTTDPITITATATITTANPTTITTLTLASSPIVVTPAVFHLVFSSTGQPSGGKSGLAMTNQPVVEVENALNVVVSSWSSPITLSTSGGILGCGLPTQNGGKFTFTDCTFAGGYTYNLQSGNGLGTAYTMTASSSGALSVTSNAFSVSGPGNPALLVFSQEPTGVASGSPTTAFTQQPQVTEEDSFGNMIYKDNTSQVMLTISSGQTLTCASNTVTLSNGVAAFSGCHGSAYANGITLTASWVTPPTPPYTVGTSNTFNITGAATQLAFTTQPLAAASGLPFTTQPVVTVEDSTGQVVTSWQYPITLSVTTPNTNGILTNCTDLAPINGVVKVASCDFSGLVGTKYTLTAADSRSAPATPPLLTSAVSAQFSPTTFGAATQLVFTTQPVGGAAGTTLATQPVVKVEDAGGNVVTSSSNPITLTASGGVLSSCTHLNAVSGVVNVTGCVFGGVVNTQYTLTAADANTPASLSSAVSQGFTPSGPGVVSATASTVTASPGVVPANGSSTSTVTVTLYDGYTNVVPAQSVTLGQGLGTSVITTNPTLTNSSGVATFAVKDATPQSVTYVATDTTESVMISQSAVVAFFGAPTQVVLTSTCTPSVVSGSTCTATATIEDVNGTTVANYSGAVTFSQANTPGGTVNGLGSVTSFTNGVATETLTGITAGSVSIHAVGDGFTSGTITFNVTAGTGTKLVITSTPINATASTTTRNAFTVTLEDTNGNATTSASAITVNLSASPATGSSFYAAATGGSAITSVTLPANTSTVNGYFVDSVSGTPTITAAATGLTSGTQVETITAGAATQVVLTSTCTPSVTSGSTCTATATVEDVNNNTVNYSGTVTFSQTNTPGGTVNGLGSVTSFTNGVATETLTGITAGSVSIHAVGDTFTSNTITFTVNPGSATQVVLTSTCTPSVTSGSTCTATATVEDVNNNTVNYSGTVTFSQTNTPGGTVNGLGSVTHFTNGVATETLTGITAGSVSIHAVGDGFTSGTITFTVNPGAGTKLVITSTPINATASTTTRNAFTVTLEDTNGNATTSASAITVNLSASPATGSSFYAAATGGSAITSVTLPANTSTVNGYFVDSVSGTPTITAAATGLTSGTQVETITAGAATQVVLTSTCTPSVTSGSTCTATATVEDVNNNTVNYSGTVTFSQTNTPGGTVNGLGSVTSFTNGVATETLTGITAGSVSIHAVGDGFTSGTITFNVNVGAATKVVLTSTCTPSVTSGSTCTATATVEDVNNNTVNYSGTVTFSQTNTPGGTVNGLGSVTSFTNGVATETLTGITAGSVSIHAVGDGFTSGTITFNVTAGAGTKLVITSTPINATASTTTRNAFTVTLEDTNGNATTSASAITVNLSASPATGSSFYAAATGGSAITSVTLPANTSTVNGYFVDSVSGTPTITAAATGLTSGTQVETINPGAGTKLVITSTPINATASTTTRNAFTVTLEDTNGNLATSASAITVNLSASPATGSSFYAAATGGSAITSVTLPANTSTVNGYFVDSVSGTPTITAAATGLTSGTQVETITAGAATQVVLTSTCTPSVTSGSTCTATATVEDVNNNTVNYSGTVTFSQTNTPGGTVNGLGSVTSFTNGVATETLTGITAGSVSIHAVGDTFTSNTITFTVNPGSATQVVLTSTCTPSVVSGSTCTATATVEDVNNNTVNYSGTVTFSQTNTPGGTVNGLGSVTSFTNGVATETLTGITAGSVSIHAVGDGFTSGTITFNVTAGTGTKLVITSTPINATASTTTRNAFTVTLEDTNGNATTSASAITVNLSASPATGSSFYAAATGGSAITSVTLPANTSTVNGYFVDSVSGTPAITAAATGLTSGTQVETITAGAATQVVLTSTCTPSVTSGSTCTATATVEDVNNNTVNYSGTVTFSQTNTPGGTVNGLGSVTSFTNGVATETLTGITAGSVSIHAVGDGFTSGTITFNVTAGTGTKLVITSTPINATASTTTRNAFTVTLEDTNGNLATSASAITVNLSALPSTGSSFYAAATGGSAITSVTLPANTSTVNGYFVDSVSGTPAITAAATGLTSGSQTETINPGAATQVALTSTCTPSVTSGSTCMAVAAVEDVNNNTVNYSGTVTFSQTNTPGGTVNGLGSVTSFTNGVATETLTGITAGSVSIHAVGDTFTSNTITFTVNPGAGTKLVITSTPINATASTTTRNAFTVTLEDTNGNLATSASAITVNLSALPSTGSSFYAAATGGSAITSVTLPANTSTVNGYFVDSVSGTPAITAAATGLTSGSQTETINPGAATQVALTSTCTPSVTSGSTCMAVAAVEDVNNNTVNYSGTVTFSQTNTPGGTVNGLGSVTSFTNGVATETLTGITAGSVSIHAVGDTFTSNTITFTVNPGAGTKLVITSAPINVAHSTTHQPFTITLEDANGNATTSATAITVNLASTPSTTFYAGVTGGFAVTSVTLPANTQFVLAYIRQNSAATLSVTVSATGLTSGTQTETFT